YSERRLTSSSAASASQSSSSSPWPAGQTMKSNSVLPCGVSRPAHAGRVPVTSLVTRPWRNSATSSPSARGDTRISAREKRRWAVMALFAYTTGVADSSANDVVGIRRLRNELGAELTHSFVLAVEIAGMQDVGDAAL